eukprot:6483112-Amphidinium_carterae.3
MSDRTVDLATKQLVPTVIANTFSSFSPAISKVFGQFGFFASRESVLTLAELESTQLIVLAQEMQAALPPPLRDSEGSALQEAIQTLANIGAHTLPTSALPAELGYAKHKETDTTRVTPPPWLEMDALASPENSRAYKHAGS